MEYYKCEYATITYLREINTVEVIWKKKIDSAGYKEVFTKGLHALQHFNTPNWLSDTTLQGIVSPADRKWMETTVLPTAIKSGLRNIAVIIPKDVFKKHYVDSVKRLVEMECLTMHYFDCTADAKAWLKNLEELKQTA